MRKKRRRGRASILFRTVGSFIGVGYCLLLFAVRAFIVVQYFYCIVFLFPFLYTCLVLLPT